MKLRDVPVGSPYEIIANRRAIVRLNVCGGIENLAQREFNRCLADKDTKGMNKLLGNEFAGCEFFELSPEMIPVFMFEEMAFGFLTPETEVQPIQRIIIE